MLPTRNSSKGLFTSFIRRFRRREDGIISVEAMLILPLLFWSMFASYTYYDAYRQSARNIKGAYAVADVISREDGDVNAAYVNTMYDLLQAMVETRAPVTMRMTYLTFDGENDIHDVLWSCVRGTALPKWSNADIDEIKPSLPAMPDNGSMIVVETRNTYRPPFFIAFEFSEFEMNNLVFTHPRVFDNIANSDPSCIVA
ncbi:hypothetical protein [uncultured Ruegeria sp.]|uniref:TadE/TadG family type IV pilus assembly protein n=1 Tax=uncultured Ruegeria sp. TaxID=259304 RepID=UPI002636D192|nr:hypothetical protein [uncultured Ruegeria sp.]